jgi:hypothetical protein
MIDLDSTARPAARSDGGRGSPNAFVRRVRRWSAARWTHIALASVMAISSLATIAAMRRTSPTFDEITTMAAGARGFHVGRFDMMENYPPLTQYLYGLPVYLSGPNYPHELRPDTVPNRYGYAQDFLYRAGNDPERVAFLARLGAAACSALLVLLTFLFASRSFGRGAGLMAATLVAFLPDVLAHGGVAYNDIAIAAAFLAALWGIDAGLRSPSLARGVAAGVLVSLAVGTKHSALLLGPIALVLIAMELAARWQQRELKRALRPIAVTFLAALVAGYFVQVAIYQGDFTLAYLRESTIQAHAHITGGHGVPAYLLGRMTADAPWYFYPVVFLYKTSVALHLLIIAAVAGAALAARGLDARVLLSARVRAPLVAALLFGAVLVNANLVIGFRYALPVLPLICILTAAGAMTVWRRTTPALRALLVVLTAWSAASALAYYPHFLAYTSEYQAEPELGYTVFADSNLDWGQGLLELRDFMADEDVDRVFLSYFGSGVPTGYGIDYIAMPSFFPLEPSPLEGPAPRFAAISATNLIGLYLNGDPFGDLRRREPYRVLGHTMFIYEVNP